MRLEAVAGQESNTLYLDPDTRGFKGIDEVIDQAVEVKATRVVGKSSVKHYDVRITNCNGDMDSYDRLPGYPTSQPLPVQRPVYVTLVHQFSQTLVKLKEEEVAVMDRLRGLSEKASDHQGPCRQGGIKCSFRRKRLSGGW